MFEPLTQRRYLDPVQGRRLPQQFTDVLVIGGGVAGLRAAIAAADGGADVLLLTKDTIDQSNTWYAQGGIAAVLQPADSYRVARRRHREGRGGAVRSRGGGRRHQGRARSACSNCSSGARISTSKPATPHGLAFTREGRPLLRPHPPRLRRRHRQGTGADADPHRPQPRADPHLREQLRHRPADRRRTDAVGRAGADRRAGQPHLGQARRSSPAAGRGSFIARSTNPKIATADGHAMAYRAGATLQDMEMVQFHPTTLYVAGAQPGADHRSGPRRRGVPGRSQRLPLHDGLSRDGRAGAARRGEPGDRRADPQDAFHARLPRRAAPAGQGVPRAVPATGQAAGRVRDRPVEGPDPDPPRRPLHDRRRGRRR